MIRSFTIISALLLVSACQKGGTDSTEAEEGTVSAENSAKSTSEGAVKTAFEDYRSALTAQDGDKAVAAVTADSMKRYENYRDLALSASKDKLRSLSFSDRMMTFLLRARLSAEKMKALPGKELFSFSVSQGWSKTAQLSLIKAGEVKIKGDSALLEVQVPGSPESLLYRFEKEAGSWKLDLPSLLDDMGRELEGALKRDGVDENTFLSHMVEGVGGPQAPKSMWRPLLEGEPSAQEAASPKTAP